MIEKGSVRYLASPVLQSCDGVTHAFLSRAGGVSPAPFDSLNLGYAGTEGTDSPELVDENFTILGGALGVTRKNLFAIRQVHGSRVVVAEDEDGGGNSPICIEADGAVTARKGVAVGVLTADCLPVLLYDPAKRVAGAAHAGWKGTEQEISAKTVEVMRTRFGSRAEDIRAALGPCIGPCCYEIGGEVAERFSGANGMALLRKNGRITLDIALANTVQLIGAGLKNENITRPGACTSCDNHNFFSYRKDGGSTGRQLSFIIMRD